MLAAIGAFLILPTILFASVGLWVAVAAGLIGVAYLWVLAIMKWRKPERTTTRRDPTALPPVEPWQAWAFLVVMLGLTVLLAVSANSVIEWVGFAVVVAGVGLGVWMLVVLTRRGKA